MDKFHKYTMIAIIVAVFLISGGWAIFPGLSVSIAEAQTTYDVYAGQSIQAAIDNPALTSGDIILVHDGTYTENIDFLGKAITVKSQSGAGLTTIDGSNPSNPDFGSTVNFRSGEGSSSVLDGFTITKGRGSINEFGPLFGGGIYCGTGTSPLITNCVITGNSIGDGGAGGGISCFNSSPTITGCIISGNSAGGGGGVYCDNSSAKITGCTIELNTGFAGGGIYSQDSPSSLEITDCTISENTATYGGGGITCFVSTPTINGCTIRDNTAANRGGGISCSDSSPTITNCTLTGNVVVTGEVGIMGVGGGIYCEDNSTPLITNCVISGNSAGTSFCGGGISSINSSPTITGCTISGNSAVGGGGICCENSPSIITNCTISGNSADGGGGILCYVGSSPTITNCTIAGNLAAVGGGILCFNSSSPIVVNSILWGNSPNEVRLSDATSSITITYSNIQGGDPDHPGSPWPGIGNIGEDPMNHDPLFVDPRDASFAPTTDGNYHLQQGSPCIDAADSNHPVPDTDRDGFPRYDDPDTTNTGTGPYAYYDMGAYEYEFFTETQPTDTGGVKIPFIGGGVTLTFETITAPGNTTVAVLSEGQAPPSGYQVQGQYYDISTTAGYSGLITVCLPYDGTNLSDDEEQLLKLLHYDETLPTPDWVDIVPSRPRPQAELDSDKICGQTSSLSPFIVVLPEAPSPTGTSVTPTPDNPTPGTGEQVCMRMDIADVTGLYAASFDLNYDPAMLDYTGITEGSFLNEGITDPATTQMQAALLDGVPGQLVVGITRLGDIGGISGSGDLATVCFNALGASCSSSDIVLSNTSLEGAVQGDEIAATWNGETITVMLPSPTGLSPSDPGSHDAIDLSWTAIAEATAGYEIYRSDFPDGPFVSLGTSPTNSYQDTGCIIPTLDYYYQVRAIGDSCESQDSTMALGSVAGLLGDINNDGRVNGRDLSQLARAFGTGNDCQTDLDRTGLTDGEDLIALAADFGKTQ